MLRAFGDQMLEGVLLFRADGQLIMANAIARQSLCKEDPTDDRNLGERISQVLPADALNQARSKGSWTGSLPVSDRVVIAHLYYNEEQGVGHFLALFHNIEGQQDYERELQQRHAELRQAYLRLNGAQDKLLQSEKWPRSASSRPASRMRSITRSAMCTRTWAACRNICAACSP